MQLIRRLRRLEQVSKLLLELVSCTQNTATSEGTQRFAERFENAAEGNFREFEGLTLSSLGIGTYLGNWDEKTDQAYIESIKKFVELGGNVIDTAANYRFQRSERNIGVPS